MRIKPTPETEHAVAVNAQQIHARGVLVEKPASGSKTLVLFARSALDQQLNQMMP